MRVELNNLSVLLEIKVSDNGVNIDSDTGATRICCLYNKDMQTSC